VQLFGFANFFLKKERIIYKELVKTVIIRVDML
jgi:hypothetical protein